MGGQEPPGWPPAGHSGPEGMPGGFPGMQAPGLDIDRLRKNLKRRVMLFLMGFAMVLVGSQIDPVALGWPLWTGTAAWITGLAVAMIGALGPTTGAGCLAQLLGVILLGSLVCNATATSHPGTPVLTIAVVVAAGAGMFLRRRRAENARAQFEETVRNMHSFTRADDQSSPSGGPVIDVDAQDKS